MQTRITLIIFAFLMLLCGCGGGEASTDGGGGSGGAGGGPAADQFAFDTDEYTLASGEEQTYMCFTIHLPDEKLSITSVDPIYGKAMHHLAIYWTLAPEPEGTFNCEQLSSENWIPLFLGGVETSKLTLPEGAGMTLPKGAQILVQLHLLNTTAETVTDKAHITFGTSKDPNILGAGVYGFDNRAFTIPASGQMVEVSQTCAGTGHDMDVFAVLGHMHQYGRKIELSRGATPGQEVLYTATWDFQDQPTVPTTFHVSKDDTMNVRCWYDNPGSVDLGYGESSLEEMCAFVLYYTPYTALDGCIKAAP